MNAPTLRPYQEEFLNSIAKALQAGQNRVLCKAPTGTGKTVCFAAMLTWDPLKVWLSHFPATDRLMLVIAHREELLDQAQAKIQAANPGMIVDIEQGERVASPYADVIIASIQTLAWGKFRRLERILRRRTPRIVIVDEAHHAAAKTYRGALALMGFLPKTDPTLLTAEDDVEAASWDDVAKMEEDLKGWDEQAPKDRLLVGVTATPNRSDTVGLGCVFQDIVYSYDLKKAVEDGWLVKPVPYVIESDTSLDSVRTTAGEFNQGDLARAVNQARRNQLAVKGWQECAVGRPTICFTVDVAHAHAMADLFTTVGVRAKAISGETPKDERREALRAFTAGEIDVLCNCMLLTEGTDLPRTSCILHAKPTKSATLYEQMTGRGLRLFPDKTECRIIDVVDVSRRHSLQSAPTLYGLPPNLLGAKGEPLDQIADEWDRLRDEFPQLEEALEGQRLSIAQLRIKAKTFDIWRVRELDAAIAAVVTLKWLRVEDDIYQLQYPWNDGSETLQVNKDLLGKWEIVCTITPAERTLPKRQRTIAHGIIDQATAATMAESFINQERRNVVRLKSKDAPWMRTPPTDAQLRVLRKHNVNFNPKTLTKGEASDIIGTMFAKQARRSFR